MIHILKCWTIPFQDIVSGKKTFEIRKNDRNYKVGDILVLKEYDNIYDSYTGEIHIVRVNYMIDCDPFFYDNERDGHFVAMSISNACENSFNLYELRTSRDKFSRNFATAYRKLLEEKRRNQINSAHNQKEVEKPFWKKRDIRPDCSKAFIDFVKFIRESD